MGRFAVLEESESSCHFLTFRKKTMRKFQKLIALFVSISMLTATVGAIEVSPDTVSALETYTLDALPQNIRVSLQNNDQIVSIQKDDDLYSITAIMRMALKPQPSFLFQ